MDVGVLFLRDGIGVAVWEASGVGGIWGPGRSQCYGRGRGETDLPFSSHSQKVCSVPGHGALPSGDSQALGRQALAQPLPQSKARVPSSGEGTGWCGGLEASSVKELRVRSP